MSEHKRCSHPGCDARGTHRVVFLLSTEGVNPIVRKCELEGERRCEAHHEKNPEAFLQLPGWNLVWPYLAERFGRHGFAQYGYVPVAVRALTTVHYIPEDGVIEEIPVMVATPGGLEQDRKLRVHYDS